MFWDVDDALTRTDLAKATEREAMAPTLIEQETEAEELTLLQSCWRTMNIKYFGAI